jgi:hypothetical protein
MTGNSPRLGRELSLNPPISRDVYNSTHYTRNPQFINHWTLSLNAIARKGNHFIRRTAFVVTSCRLAYRINIAHSSARPRAGPNNGLKRQRYLSYKDPTHPKIQKVNTPTENTIGHPLTREALLRLYKDLRNGTEINQIFGDDCNNFTWCGLGTIHPVPFHKQKMPKK